MGGVEGLDASLFLWMGTFIGWEVASRMSIRRVLLKVSEWMWRRDDRLLDDFEFSNDKDDEDDRLEVMCLIGRSKKSHIVTKIVTAAD